VLSERRFDHQSNLPGRVPKELYSLEIFRTATTLQDASVRDCSGRATALVQVPPMRQPPHS